MNITYNGNSEDKKKVSDRLYFFNRAHFPKDLDGRYEEVTLFLKDDNDETHGGLIGEICWNWLEIHILIVDETLRGSGHGSKLLREAERIAREKKCDFIKLDTLSFQALDFYEKQGYSVYGVLDNVGREHKHYYLKKDLK
ncbi:MAG: GNAT family N-acetyltransferase [Bacillaceae bacterium]|nr:GNAT family N-acetyltransferase [Bacillaceae bacterium]